MTRQWQPPDNHLITLDRARELLSGELGKVYRKILMECCAPFHWSRRIGNKLDLCSNGTLTIVRTSERLIGVTARHVVQGYLDAREVHPVVLQVMSAEVRDLNIIAMSSKGLDLATIELDEELLAKLGKAIVPLSGWPPLAPEEGRGIMLAGYPGGERIFSAGSINWGLFTALGVARVVTHDQITWTVEREYEMQDASIPSLPPQADLGGVSGGPVVGWFETASGITQYRLCGIISQASAMLENVVAKRAEFIMPDGSVREP